MEKQQDCPHCENGYRPDWYKTGRNKYCSACEAGQKLSWDDITSSLELLSRVDVKS